MLSSMLEDIRTRYTGAERPDLLFLTGDIAFSGKQEEYALAADFIDKLRSTLSLPPDRVCVVPGNHDIDISREEDAVAGARSLLKTSTEVDRFLGNEGRRKTLFARQAAFRDFANKLSRGSSPTFTSSSYAHSRTLQIGEVRIRVLFLDSSWLALGGAADEGELLVGERQVLDCGEVDDGCLTVALVHHPFGWLREFERVSIENLVMRCSQLCLRGHVHAPDLRSIDGRQGRLTVFTAGAGFQSRITDNTYMWCSLDLTTGSGSKIVHRYRHADHLWEASERESWSILPTVPPPSDVVPTRSALLRTTLRYKSYVACLVSKLQTEVPLALPNGKVAFVPCDVTIPNTANICGEVILRMRNHFYWKRVWDSAHWDTHLLKLATELEDVFASLEATAGEALQLREESSSSLVESFNQGEGKASAVCDELRNLLAQGELERARAVMDRWRGQSVVRPAETHELHRLEVFLLLAEKQPGAALLQATSLVAKNRQPDDIALAARCALDAKNVALAATLMHEALDGGVSVDVVRAIARTIAGASGDKQLAERVRS